MLYTIDDDELARIDRKEGYDWADTRVQLPVRLEAGGQEHAAIIYTVRYKEESEIPPSHEYLRRVIVAAHARGLPDSYIERLEAMSTAESRAAYFRPA